MTFVEGMRFNTVKGICEIDKIPPDGTGSIKLKGCLDFWCGSWEIRRWIEIGSFEVLEVEQG